MIRRPKKRRTYSPEDMGSLSAAFNKTSGFAEFASKLPDTQREALRASGEKEALYNMREALVLGVLRRTPSKWGHDEKIVYSSLPPGSKLTLAHIDAEIKKRDAIIDAHLSKLGKLKK
jgi:hypothetical protein